MNTGNTAHDDLQGLIESAKGLSESRDPAALQTWLRAAEASARLMGATHCWTVFCINNVGKTLVDQGECKKAIPLLESSLRSAQVTFGQAHFCVEHASQSLGRAYGQLGDHARAAHHWDAAAQSSDITRGTCHQTTLFCLSQKARALMRQNLHSEALPILRKVLGRTQRTFGRHVYTAYAARELAACLNQLGCFKEAIPLWKYTRRCFIIDREKNRKHILNATRCLAWAEHNLAASADDPVCFEEISAGAFIIADMLRQELFRSRAE